ncbi:MAG TPA: hypothetical protein VMA77_21080 [Solirubrobacteraceae bacterium]|nr:hypothetical protein [Solirubrobacteraceae bacterium]
MRLVVLLVALAAVAVGIVLVLSAGPGAAERQLVSGYVHDWAAGDYPHMYA